MLKHVLKQVVCISVNSWLADTELCSEKTQWGKHCKGLSSDRCLTAKGCGLIINTPTSAIRGHRESSVGLWERPQGNGAYGTKALDHTAIPLGLMGKTANFPLCDFSQLL